MHSLSRNWQSFSCSPRCCFLELVTHNCGMVILLRVLIMFPVTKKLLCDISKLLLAMHSKMYISRIM